MSKVAEQLRQAREAKNLTVHQVAEATKIRTDHIRALDEGNYDVFSAPVYIRGFVRTYGGFLKLDVPKLIEELNKELSSSEKHQERFPSPNRTRTVLDVFMYLLSKVNWKVVIPVLGIAVVLVISIYAYRAWATAKARDPLADLGPGLYQSTQQVSGDVLPLPQPRPSK